MDEQSWKVAEAAARSFYQAKGWTVTAINRYASLPYFMQAEFSDGALDLLVWGGKVVPEKGGLPSLEVYFKASDFLLRRSVDTAVFLRLLYYANAFPDAGNAGIYDSKVAHPELLPRLIFDDKGAHFTINYVASSASPAGLGGSAQDASTMAVDEWTLRVPLDYHVAWSLRRLTLKR
jgi:hypothetical protein